MIPEVSKTFFERIPVLTNDSRDSIRARKCQSQTSGCTVVEYINGEFIEFEYVREFFDRLCQVGERINVFARIWDHRESESRQIGRDHSILESKPGDKVSVLEG